MISREFLSDHKDVDVTRNHRSPYIVYGTAGFRAHSEWLESVLFRVGVYIACRARILNRCLGIIVTASHNPPEYNGVKIVDVCGSMLPEIYEKDLECLVNCDDEIFETKLREIIEPLLINSCYNGILNNSLDDIFGSRVTEEARKKKSDYYDQTITSHESHLRENIIDQSLIVIGYDTRESCNSLVSAAVVGVSFIACRHRILGMVTTPFVHHYVRRRNASGGVETDQVENTINDVVCDVSSRDRPYDLYENICINFKIIRAIPTQRVLMDCAGGVGFIAMTYILNSIAQDQRMSSIRDDIVIFNSPSECTLNTGCGADFVYNTKVPPCNTNKYISELGIPTEETVIVASIDGDADRLVYIVRNGGIWRVVDGDRIGVYLISSLKKIIEGYVHDADTIHGKDISDVFSKITMINTAYTNSECVRYILKDGKAENIRTKTGVKHLHSAAITCQIGVYFESNGHGTILFSDESRKHISVFTKANQQTIDGGDYSDCIRDINCLVDLFNQSTGDALSNFFAVQAIQHMTSTNIESSLEFYIDRPVCNISVSLDNVHHSFKQSIRCSDDDTRVEEPGSLKKYIDGLKMAFTNVRLFLRPSGTEPVIRIFVESDSVSDAEYIGMRIREFLEDPK